MKKKLIFLLSTLAIATTLVGCGESGIVKQSIEQGKQALSSNEYDKALASFQLALDNDKNNEEAKTLENIVENYLTAKKDFNENKLDDAKTTLDEISGKYNEYPIKDAIDSFKKEVNDKIELNNKIEKSITEANKLFEEKKYTECVDLIKKIKENTLNDTQTKIVDDLNNKANNELKEIERKKAAQAEEKKKNEIPTTNFPSFTEKTKFSADGYVMYKGIKLPSDSEKFTPELMHEVAEKLPEEEAFKVFKNYGISDGGAFEYIYKVKNGLK